MSGLLARRGGRARVYGVGIVLDATRAKTTWHLQRELQALLEEKPEVGWELGSCLGAYLTGRPAESGRSAHRALFGARAMSPSQEAAAERCWGSKLTAVQGPPGTGKSTLILQLAAEALVRQVDQLADRGTHGRRRPGRREHQQSRGRQRGRSLERGLRRRPAARAARRQPARVRAAAGAAARAGERVARARAHAAEARARDRAGRRARPLQARAKRGRDAARAAHPLLRGAGARRAAACGARAARSEHARTRAKRPHRRSAQRRRPSWSARSKRRTRVCARCASCAMRRRASPS